MHVLKGSNSEEIGNFRPSIGIVSGCCKSTPSSIHMAQSGFWPQDMYHTGCTRKYNRRLEAGSYEDRLVGSIMADLSKAFDTVSHPTLERKQASYGVHEGQAVCK